MEDEFDGYDMNIELIDYCVVVLGRVEGAKDEISKVSQTPPKYMDAKGLVISVFKSAMNTRELTDYFKLSGRTFLLFELGDDNFGVHLNEKFNRFLFGGLISEITEEEEDISKDVLDTLENNMRREARNYQYDEYKETTSSGMTEEDVVTTGSTEEFGKMTEEQQKKEVDTIIGKISSSGVNSLSEFELEILKKFS